MSDVFDRRRYLSDFDVSRVGHLFTDVLVAGVGVAGARAAIGAAGHGDVIVITKGTLEDSATHRAQGGIAVASGPEDSPEKHMADTLKVGGGLNSKPAVERLVRQAGPRIEELLEWGSRFDGQGPELDRAREGGHSQARILHAHGDATGRELARTLLHRLQRCQGIRVFEHCYLIDLITLDGRCVGAVTFHPQYGHQLIWANQTILAAGGSGQLYRETTNPSGATGDGLAAAYRAGARLADMELVQFHPTTLYVAGSTRALISEAVRGEGAYLVDRTGQRFMQDYHPDGELAPRDVVSQAIQQHLRSEGGNCVYLDVRHLGGEAFAKRFPWITRRCAEFGIDVGRDLIPVNPGAHYSIGGVVTDLDGRTNLEGLLACGEAACNGVHGANRLASNSLLEGLVFGSIAGRVAGEAARGAKKAGPPGGISNLNPHSKRTALDLADVVNSLKSVMWRNVGVVRQGERLRETVEITEFWGKFVMDKTFDEVGGWQTQNLLSLARLTAWAAELRRESLGVHHRSDGPIPPTADPPAHLVVARSDDGPMFSWVAPDFEIEAG
ncbi:MAG: L-aspartate oxidase [Phycisphaerae bacterium]